MKTYEDAVLWMRSQERYSKDVLLNYFDEDINLAVIRFEASEEFISVKRHLGLNKNKAKLKILDMGSGHGIASYAFSKLGHDVISVDPSRSNVSGLGAVNKIKNDIHLPIYPIQAYAESLPLKDNYFDIVYARQCLHHFKNLNKGVNECHRVLRENGLFFATREHVISDNNQLKLFLDNHIFHQIHKGEMAYTEGEYKDALINNGFKIIKHLKSYDDVINYYPKTTEDIHKIIYFKFTMGRIYKISTLFKIWNICKYLSKFTCNGKNSLSNRDNNPGRMNSFLAIHE